SSNFVGEKTRTQLVFSSVFFEPLELRRLMSVTQVGVVNEAPSGLAATKVDIDRVSLSWKDNCTREIGFYVNCSKDGGKTWDSAASNLAKVTPLAAPKTMTATTFSSSRIDLKWDAVTGAANYDLQCLFDTSWKTIVTLDNQTTAYSNAGRYSATQYSYRVRAFSANARSTFTNADATTVPDAPTALAANNAVAGQITLGWNPVTGATGGYTIERRTGTDD